MGRYLYHYVPISPCEKLYKCTDYLSYLSSKTYNWGNIEIFFSEWMNDKKQYTKSYNGSNCATFKTITIIKISQIEPGHF